MTASKSSSSAARRRGVATFFSVAAIGLVGMAILAMSTMLRIDHRRTQAAGVDAQLRQLLIAGAGAAQAEVDKTPEGEIDRWITLSLPSGLAEAQAAVQWKREPSPAPDTVVVLIAAEYVQGSARQRIELIRAAPGQRFAVTNATLLE